MRQVPDENFTSKYSGKSVVPETFLFFSLLCGSFVFKRAIAVPSTREERYNYYSTRPLGHGQFSRARLHQKRVHSTQSMTSRI